MTVKASEIKYIGIEPENKHKKECGCIMVRRFYLGSYQWILDLDGMCKKHKKEHLKEYFEQEKFKMNNKIEALKTARKKKKQIKKEEKEMKKSK